MSFLMETNGPLVHLLYARFTSDNLINLTIIKDQINSDNSITVSSNIDAENKFIDMVMGQDIIETSMQELEPTIKIVDENIAKNSLRGLSNTVIANPADLQKISHIKKDIFSNEKVPEGTLIFMYRGVSPITDQPVIISNIEGKKYLVRMMLRSGFINHWENFVGAIRIV